MHYQDGIGARKDVMAKLKLFCGSVVLLILSVSFSSFFTLTALAKLYGKSSGVLDPSVEFEMLVVPHGRGAVNIPRQSRGL